MVHAHAVHAVRPRPGEPSFILAASETNIADTLKLMIYIIQTSQQIHATRSPLQRPKSEGNKWGSRSLYRADLGEYPRVG